MDKTLTKEGRLLTDGTAEEGGSKVDGTAVKGGKVGER